MARRSSFLETAEPVSLHRPKQMAITVAVKESNFG